MSVKHNSATIIQRVWKKYIAPRCPRCFLPVLDPHSARLPGYCTCKRCPGCLKFTDDGAPCSVSCEPWFPPLDIDNNSDEDDSKIYQKWVKGKPIYTDHLGYFDTYGGREHICTVQ